MKKNFFLLAFVLVLLSTAVVTGFVRPAAAQEPIYIRADGSIEGTTAISTVDNTTYTFTDNINDDRIVVERSNIIIDGAGYTLETSIFLDIGFTLSGVNNVTIKNITIKGFTFVAISLGDSSNNNIIANTITAIDADGIVLTGSSNNNISGNTITSNGVYGIGMIQASNNSIIANNIANNSYGIRLDISSNNNSIIANNITANENAGIRLDGSSNNMIYHNNFVDNGQQVDIVVTGSSVWDDGVGMGNYWSDYESRYPNATEVDGSGIWDTPYVIDGSNQDNYPIIPEFPTWTSTLLALILLTVVITTYKRRLLKTPIH